MKQTREFLTRHSLVIGILLMFLFTWPIDLANSGVVPIQVPFAVAILVGYGFVAASLIMTGLTLGKAGVIALLKRFLIWRVNWKWYLVALALYPTLFLSAVALNAVLTQTPIDFTTVLAYRIFGAGAYLPLLVVPYFLFDALANGEEMGWRGYVLPRLQVKYSALAASLILGVIWGFWHLPKFLGNWNTTLFALFMIKTMADAVLYTWLYNSTRGSLLLVTFFHASGNAAAVFLPIANTVSAENLLTFIISIILIISSAVIVTIAARSARLSRLEPKQIQSPA